MPRNVVLVTGAGGFIGRWSVPALIARGYEVHAVLARSAGRNLVPQLAGAVAHWADLLDGDVPRTLVDGIRPSHLLHFAWTATPGVYWTSSDNYRWLAASQTLL
ncbi:MAG: NAD-dependent epimerase/dehydratase family protein, partial [Pseudomonadota bacterium]|nr:NAD-dependent epimerase/dehydratase family protein [Pseudomonadota bacterium]